MRKPRAIFLMGPTASGKTGLAIDLCQHLPCDIISVDSALIYRGMDIGTAKPTVEEQALAPHRLIDILDPSQSYSAADFRADALRHMAEISAAGRVPLLVGGTMMYYKVLLEGMSPLPEADLEIRRQIESQANDKGWQALHDELRVIDPVAADRIHPNDPQRLSRALEVFRISGKTLTELTEAKTPPLDYDVAQFAIAPDDRAVLHKRIAERFDLMLKNDFEAEVESLRGRGDLHLDLPSMRCVGYRQMWQYLDGDIDHSTMVDKGVAATRQLAKRQLTWLRSWSNVTWLNTFSPGNAKLIMSEFEGPARSTDH